MTFLFLQFLLCDILVDK